MSTEFFAVSTDYGLVILTSAALAIMCFSLGPTVIASRRKHFNKEFMDQFREEHQREIGEPLPDLGFPDIGSGRYSAKLSYKSWFEFNNAQRTHQNFIEALTVVISCTLTGGLRFPIPATIIGGLHFIGRLIYIIGYRFKGPRGRSIGAVLNILTTSAIMLLALISGFAIYFKK
eukprot:TRINITY_DN2798_c0_g1_i1.p1 TRINITY_DN2798_c0_g1~~TRINITY_DN2798_c0_g1_i1.p1  ORF type:complete len:174 (+),score=13.76 TRINITY_DN2798_c0_g1_i1:43-564(+)